MKLSPLVISKLLFLLVLVISNSFSQSQNNYPKSNTDKAVEVAKLRKVFKDKEKDEITVLSLKNGIPLVTRLDDGRAIKADRIEGGQIVYSTTFTLNAAKTISTYKLWPETFLGYDLTGFGIDIGLWDDIGVNDVHREISNSIITHMEEEYYATPHATFMAGVILSHGLYYQNGPSNSAKGMAKNADLYVWDISFDDVELAAADNTIQISNHSYGDVCGWEYWGEEIGWRWHGNPDVSETEDYKFGYYGEETAFKDNIVYELRPYRLMVTAAGNNRDNLGPGPNGLHEYKDSEGIWVESTEYRDPDGGLDMFDCIASPNATGKNVLTVGAVGELLDGYTPGALVDLMPGSGWGPTDDGRIKPDIVANGDLMIGLSHEDEINQNHKYVTELGQTSAATASVTGSAALILEHYKNLFPDREAMLASTLKALIIHTSDDLGNPGPDYKFGWGLMNTKDAVDLLSEDYNDGEGSHLAYDLLSTSEEIVIPIQPDGMNPLEITICWSDPPGPYPPIEFPTLNPTEKRLVNDLDLRVEDPSQIHFYPYVMTPIDPNRFAENGDNDLDNVEKIIIDNPESGIYTAHISHEGILLADQAFSIIVSGGRITEPLEPPPSPDPDEFLLTWDQRLEDDTSIGQFKFYDQSGTNHADLPKYETIPQNADYTSIVEATKNIYFNEKFFSWNDDSYKFLRQFQIKMWNPHNKIAILKPSIEVEIHNDNASIGGDGKLYFKDPWYIDTENPEYDNPDFPTWVDINLGLNAPFEEFDSPLNLSYISPHKGVIKDLDPVTHSAFYEIEVEHFFVANNNIYEFYKWNVSPTGYVDFTDPFSSTTAIIFRQDGASVSAEYRAVNRIENYKFQIEENETLVIPPGSDIACAKGFRIESDGKIEIIGNSENLIRFIRDSQQSPSADDRLFILKDPDTQSDNWNQPWVNIEFCRFENFRNGSSSDNDPVISFVSSGPKEIFPGGSWIEKGSTFFMKNCVFNNCDWAISIDGWGGPECIYNCTFYKSPILNFDNYADFLNCIFYEGELNLNTGYYPYSTINRCVFYNVPDVNDWMALGEYNQNADPIFVDPTNNNFHIRRNSPCVDFGKPYFYLYDMTEYSYDPDGTSLDIGALYYPNLHDPVLSGDVEYDMCVSGSVQITSNLTVLSKVHLTILPGTTVKFNDDVKLKVYGTLYVSGTQSSPILFTSINSNPSFWEWYGIQVYGAVDINHTTVEYTWNGIKFETGATGSVSNSTFSDNYFGFYINSAEPTVQNCLIEDNKYGLRIFNSYSSPNWNTIHFSGNTISDNSYYGLYLYNSSPTLSGNVISSNGRSTLWSGSNPILDDNDFKNSTYYGLACYGNCSPSMYLNGSLGGHNTITNNGAQGIRITGSSDPILGRLNPSMGGYNSIYSNSGYEIDNTTSNSIMAMQNWWGSAAGPGSDYTGSVWWQPPLSYDPNDLLKILAGDFSVDPNSDLPLNLQMAYYEQSKQNYAAAAEGFRNHFINMKGGRFNARSVVQYIKSLSYFQLPVEIVKEIDALLKKELDVVTRFELLSAKANQCILAQNPGEALFALSEALKDKLTNENVNRIYLQNAMIYAYSLNDKSGAEKYFNMLIENSRKNSDYYLVAKEELSNINNVNFESSIAIAQSDVVLDNDTYNLMPNYPNPFNPETKIRFNLPEDARVKLEVYNMQGQKIITLVDNLLSAGQHTATFNGAKFSSGIYFYRIQTDKYQSVHKMILLK